MPDLTITVKNYGTDTIKSFYLNHYMPGYQLCFNLFHKLCTIPVAPNETISIQTGTFTIHTFFSVPPGTPHGSTTELNMCFFTTVPNSMIDIETSNDAKCESVLFTVTSIDEDNVSLPRISVSPNPFSSSLSLRSEILIENITLYNISGQQIQYVQPHAKEYSLNQSNLDPGIYFLHVQTDAGRVIKKVIKE
jgi:hypothetical protein